MNAIKTNKLALPFFASTALAVLGLCAAAQAQTTATWIGSAGDNDWNTAGNWDVGLVPAEGTNASIALGSAVNYNLPMTATSIGALTLGGSLTINAGGFVVDGNGNTTASSLSSGAALTINNTGALLFTNSSPITLSGDASSSAPLTVVNVTGGVLTLANSTGSSSLNVGQDGRFNGAAVTLSGANVSFDKVLNIQGGQSSGSPASSVYVSGGTLNCLGGSAIKNKSDDTSARLVVDNGAVVNLGAFAVQRSSSAGGLILSNGVVNASSIQIGTGPSQAFGTVYGGVLTNSGLFTISDTTSAATSKDRRSRFQMRGGTVVSTGTGGIVIANQSNNGGTANNSNIGGLLDISAGTLIAEMLTLIKDNTLTNAYARLQLSGSGAIYLGGGGLVANVGVSNTKYDLVLSGGTLGAKADWSSTVALPLSGTVTLNAADPAGTAHNITLSGNVSGGTGSLVKSGAGILTLTATNTYTASTVINQGTLALGPNGSISNSSSITVAAGATFDVSAGGNSLANAQVLNGNGTVAGALNATSGSSIRPGGLGTVGTLTFANSLTASGNATLVFDLTDDPTGLTKTNDFLTIAGDLNLSGTNTILIDPLNTLPENGTYKLIQYSGNFNGSLANLLVSGNPGQLTLDPVAKTISFTVTSSARAASTVVWRGGLAGNTWDTQTTSNWFNTATASLDLFVKGDTALFDGTGAANPVVNLVGSVAPASVTVVASASDYTFTGTGSLDGSGGLLKTNAGKLTILSVNGYSGVTTVANGTLSVGTVANGNLPSSLGSASSDPTNLVLNGGTTLEYLGGTASTDRGALLQTNNVTLSVTNPAATLTDSGWLTGAGTLVKAGAGVLALAGANNDYSGGTVVNSGVLQVNATSLGTAGLTNNDGTTLRFGAAFSLSNIFNANGNITIDINNKGATVAMNGAWTGSGTVTFTNDSNSGNTFTIGGNGYGGGNMSNFSGTICLGTCGANFRFNDAGNQNFGSTNATFDLGTGSATLLSRNGGSGLVIDLGALLGGPNTTLKGRTSGGSGAMTYSIGAKNLATTFAGKIIDGSGASTSITKVGTNTLTLSGDSTYSGTTTILNGTLQVGDGVTPAGGLGTSTVDNEAMLVFNRPDNFTVPNAINGAGTAVKVGTNTMTLTSALSCPLVVSSGTVALTNSGALGCPTLTLASGSTLDLSALPDPTLYSQTLLGSGTINGNLNAQYSTVLSFGDANNLGTLTVTNAVTLDGQVVMRLNRANAAANSDRLAAQSINLPFGNATLVVSNIGPDLCTGDTFQLFSMPVPMTGMPFASVVLPATDSTGTSTYVWANNLTTDGTIKLLSGGRNPVNTTRTSFASLRSGNTLTLSWPSDHLGWQLQSNSVSLSAANMWFPVANSTGTNQVSIPLGTGNAFFRMVYPPAP